MRRTTAAAVAVTLAAGGTAGAVGPPNGLSAAAVASRSSLPECMTPDSDPVDLTDVDGTLFFTAWDGKRGFGLWRTEGATSGATRLLDLPYGGYDGRYDDFGYRGLIDVGGNLFFTTKSDRTDALWRSDGTRDGTVRIKKVPDIDSQGGEGGPTNMAAVGDTLFFTANGGSGELWKSDGTTAGTVLVKAIPSDGAYYGYFFSPSNLTTVGETLFFTAEDDTGNEELWKSDGTTQGTVLVKDIYAGSEYHEGPSSLTSIGDTLYFRADDGVHGTELWKSDGTEAGTVMVDDIEPGPDSSTPVAMTSFGGELFFGARDADGSRDLWTTDGTMEGTVLVKDFGPNPVEGPGSGLGDIAVVDGEMLFAAVDETAGLELWRSDGTEAATALVEDIWPGADAGTPQSLTVLGDTLYFAADEGHGRDLWRSDGTGAGTFLVAGIPVAFGYQVRLTTSGGRLFFVATDAVHGEELWTSDGTESGTRMFRDTNQGGGFAVVRAPRPTDGNGAVRIRVLGDTVGRVEVVPVRERGIRRHTQRIEGHAFADLEVELTRAAKRKLRRTGRVEIGARFTFTSCSGAVSRETHSYTVRKR